MVLTLVRNVVMVVSVVALCATLVACSSSDDGRMAELEEQLDMAGAARMTAEQERDTAEAAQMTAEQAQAAAETAQMAAEQARATAEAARMTAEQERDTAEAAQMTAEQAQAAAETAQMAAEQARATAEAARMTAEQERDTAEAAQMTAEQAQAAAETAQMAAEQARATAEAARMTAEQERDTAEAAQMTAEQAQAAAETAQMAAEQARATAEAAQMTAEQERDDARAAQMTAEQAVDDMRNAAVTNVIEKIAAPGQPHRCALDTGCGSDSGVDYSSVSITHAVGYREHGERLIHAIPWHGDDGQVEFIIRVIPEPLQRRDLDVYTFTDLNTPDRNGDVAGNTTSYSPIEDHGLESKWQGFEAMKAYDGGGTLTVRFFTDLEDADNPLAPYTNWNADLPGEEILLNDDRVPDLTGRDSLHFSIPEDGLKGALDGVAGTFTCPEGYCSLTTSWVGPGYIPWADSAPVLFTPDGAGQSKSVRPTHLVSPSAEVPKVNYLSLGSWLYVPEVGADPDDFRFGIFAGGDDAFAGANLPDLTGTASYAGKATGMYAEKLDIDTFNADVEFMAEFGAVSDFGRISGSVSNFELGSGKPSPLDELLLMDNGPDEPNIFPGWPGSDGSISGGFIGGSAYSNEGWHGGWDAKFFGNGVTTTDIPPSYVEHPTSFAGAFGATDGVHHFAGSFGAYKQ